MLAVLTSQWDIVEDALHTRQLRLQKFTPCDSDMRDVMQLEMDRAKASLSRAQRELMDTLQRCMTDTVSALMHIKAVRCFCEAVLQYGLPATYMCYVAAKPAASAAKVIAALQQHCDTLRGGAADDAGAITTHADMSHVLGVPGVLINLPLHTSN